MKSFTQPRERTRRGSVPALAAFLTFTAFSLFALALLFSSGIAPYHVEAATDFSVAQPVTPTVQNDVTQPITPAVTVAPSDVQASPTLPPANATELPSAGTPTVDASDAVPGAQQTAVAPVPVRTNEAGSPIIPPPTPVPSVGISNPGVDPGTNNPVPQPGGTGQGGDFPWLPVVLVGLAALAGAGFMLARNRPATRVATAPGGTSARVADGEEVTSTTIVEPDAVTTASARATVAPPPIAITTATTAPVVATAPTPAKPSEVTCPNCGTENSIEENFCHECGEDLREVRTASLAAASAAPGAAVLTDVDIDTLPYLETLDRTDEQLEYVLSRPRVLIGTAQGNDIVINADFKGYGSVSPVHAELRRDEEGYVLRDRESERGTYVNDARTGESVLSDGDTLRLGEVRFIFHVP